MEKQKAPFVSTKAAISRRTFLRGVGACLAGCVALQRDSVAMRLRGAYLATHRHLQRVCAELDCTADQFVVLTVLAEQDGVMQKEVVRQSYSDSNTITALLRRLEGEEATDGDHLLRCRHQ